MKDFNTILSDAGIEVTDEQKTAIVKAMGDNYKPIADWQKQVDKVTNLTEQLNTTKDKEYQAQIADRDFSEILKDSIAAAGGKNAKAIKALLDVEKLKGSKNQKEDVAEAIKALTEAEDSKMLFGEKDPDVVEKTNPIGAVSKPSAGMSGVEAEFYKRNPELKPQ